MLYRKMLCVPHINVMCVDLAVFQYAQQVSDRNHVFKIKNLNCNCKEGINYPIILNAKIFS